MKECLRMCIACRQKKDKRQLKRVVKQSDGTICVDTSGKKDGRGAYVCSSECLVKCNKTKALNRAFKCEVSQEVYDSLIKQFDTESRVDN